MYLIDKRCVSEELKKIDGIVLGAGKATTLVMPEGLEEFGLFTFGEKVILPKNVKKIITNDSVVRVLELYYKGTAEDWERIEKISEFKGTVYFYSEDEPTEEGNFWHYDNDGNAVAWQ